MKKSFFAAIVAGATLCAAAPRSSAQQTHRALEEIASFPHQEVTGVAVSKTGRIFVNFPDWSDPHGVSVAELLPGGKLKPFPDERWNSPDGAPANRWVCVQSVFVDDTDCLWVLDPASPKMEGVVNGGAKLVKFDLRNDQLTQKIPFGAEEAPAKSYLNDVRIDSKTKHAYLTDSGLGALLVVDLQSGKTRRLLENHASTKGEPDVHLVVDGIKLIDPKTRESPQMNADGLAFDRDTGYVYFHALTAHTLYRISTAYLLDENLSERQLGERVEIVGTTPAPDGMLWGTDGLIYLTSLESNAICSWDPRNHKLETVVQDKRLQWPDSMSWGPDGSLYVSTSQIHRMPRFNRGESKQIDPFRIFKLPPP